MPRLGKKTLYLDLDALERLQAALQRLPGRPSVSSYLNEQLPGHARQMELMVEALDTGGLRGLANLFGVASEQLIELDDDVKKTLKEAKNPDRLLPEIIEVYHQEKPRKSRAKKVVKT